MRSLSIQVQPERAPELDLPVLTRTLQEIAARTELVRHHTFSEGDDSGRYLNFTFGTPRARELWNTIEREVYASPHLGPEMARASMVVCSGAEGWQDYVLLFHFDPDVSVGSGAALEPRTDSEE